MAGSDENPADDPRDAPEKDALDPDPDDDLPGEDEAGTWETALWAIVLLATPVGGLLWEFGSHVIALHPTRNLPIRYIHDLQVTIYSLAIVLGGGTIVAFVYAAIRYSDSFREAPNVMPNNWRQGSFFAWMLAVVVVLAVVGFAGTATLMKTDSEARPTAEYDTEGSLSYKVIGVQWTWMVNAKHLAHPQRRVIRMPANTTIHLRITSKDVIHSFAVQALGVKKDAVPGQMNHYWFVAHEQGRYQINCAELCGAGHSQMTPTLVVMGREEYANWVVEHGGKNPLKGVNVTASDPSGATAPPEDTEPPRTTTATANGTTASDGHGHDHSTGNETTTATNASASLLRAPSKEAI